MQQEGMNDTYREAARYLVRLIGGGLNGRDAGSKPEQASWEQVYSIAKHNSVEGMSYCGVKRLAELPPEKLYKQWNSDWNMTCYRQLQFDTEREELFMDMSARGISYLPLKGILLAGYYPEPGMRSMADNDILYGYVSTTDTGESKAAEPEEAERKKSTAAAQSAMIELMRRRGYRVKSLKDNDESFVKEPMFHFEMHRTLVSERSPFYEYYRNPWARAFPDENNGFLYSFSDEEEYVYLVAHAFKHFEKWGCGFRFLADLYVFLKKKGKGMDWSYTFAELQKLGLSEFEMRMRELSLKAFESADELTEEQEELLLSLLECGTYGTLQAGMHRKLQQLEKEDSKHVRRRYLWRRLFPEDEFCRIYFPFFYRHRLLKIFLPFYRVGKGIIKHPKKLKEEIRLLLKK